MSTKQTFTGLNELMGISSPVSTPDADSPIAVVPPEPDFEPDVTFVEGSDAGDENQQEVDDFNFARKIVQGIAEKGQELLDIALKEARNVPHPRNIEVASNVMKQLVGVSKDLTDMHAKRASTKLTKKLVTQAPQQEIPQGTNVTQINHHHHNNTTIVAEGTTTDLLDRVLAAQADAQARLEDRAVDRAKDDNAIDAEFIDVPSPRS